MQPGSVLRNQAHSQPILPSHKSQYFHNDIAGYRASQNRSRLLHLPPRSSHSPVALASSGGATARPQPQPRPHPHPFFSQGPAAMGYIPQYALGYPRYPGPQEPIIPLRTQFYKVNDSEKPMTHSQAQLKTSNTKSSSFKMLSNAAQLASQYTPDKKIQSHKTTQQEEPLASQSQPSNKPINSKGKGLNKRLSDAFATSNETSVQPIKVRIINRHTDVYNTPTQANKHASQEPQTLPETLEGDDISGSLDPIIDSKGLTLTTHAEPSQAEELSQSRPSKANKNIKTKTTTAPVPIREHSHRTLIDPPPYSHQARSSTSEIQLLTQNSPTRDEHMKSNALTSNVLKRSASQATTVSGTTTQPSCITENEDVPEEKQSVNPMSMIDETMILERDLSDIVNTRLREGKPELLDTLYGEILIKMALKDDELFEAVSRMLQQ